jgi:apolipoprotein N-acyltransferase
MAKVEIQQNKQNEIFKEYEKTKVDHIVLPETAVLDDPSYFWNGNKMIFQGLWEDQLDQSKNLKEILQLTQDYFPNAKILGGIDARSLVFGADTNAVATQKIKTSQQNIYYQNHNAAFWTKNDSIFDVYNKSKLVVGVELFPFEAILAPIFSSWMSNLGGTNGTLGISKEMKIFDDENKKIKIAPIICYESIYAYFVADAVKKGANLLYIITNDAWWGNTPGHQQHHFYAQLRAIETRKWIARSANTGISSFIDPLGNSWQNTLYNQQIGIFQTIYPNEIQTIYTTFGDYLAYISFFIIICFVFILLKKKFFNSNKR